MLKIKKVVKKQKPKAAAQDLYEPRIFVRFIDGHEETFFSMANAVQYGEKNNTEIEECFELKPMSNLKEQQERLKKAEAIAALRRKRDELTAELVKCRKELKALGLTR